MAKKLASQATSPQETPANAFAQWQAVGIGNFVGAGAAWLETMTEMNAEVMNFAVDRLKEDVKTQHKILHCQNASEVQKIQAEFVEKAIEQYQAETGKLVEMSTKAFSSKLS